MFMHTPLYVKYKNMNVTIYIKNSDFHCTAGKEKSKLSFYYYNNNNISYKYD